MDELIEAFRADKCNKMGWSSASGHAYVSHLRGLVKWLTGKLGRVPEPGDLTADYVRMYDTLRKRTGRAQRTRAAAVAAFQSFAKWLYKERKAIGLEQCAEIGEIKVKVTEKPRKRWATREEVQALFDACPRLIDGRGDNQLYRAHLATAVLAVLAYTGLRRAEVCALHVTDLDLSDKLPMITVRQGKGGKSRSLPLHPNAVRHVRAWIENRPCEHERLFAVPVFSQGGAPIVRPIVRPMSEQRMKGILVALCRIAGIDQKGPLSAHAFRRFAGTSLMKVKGCTIKHIQTFYGHSDAATSYNYLGMDQQELHALIASMEVEHEPKQQPIDPRIQRAMSAHRQAAFRRIPR